ncbi:glycosyltransferase family 29 protein [Paraglaciecola aquimarina]|uniref:Glycosyltransferase family 29 protein n=1 Tax=Paraglaciecola algarum TaxID=3050085 RepID=A0ABS9D4S2_9ALTE|nr:glycosyltransferase family 29 protein [Paraglaciecola sp. G1-23]MCF2947928.1 glycosyltransferase family 29 protein [Paraglaciecola sp. G1-23]
MIFFDHFRFGLAANLNQDSYLNKFSSNLAQLNHELTGKTVALVGNARSLADSHYGADIDANDLVIRINRAPRTSFESHGERTDWLALATSIQKQTFDELDCQRLLWMSHKRKRLRSWMAHSDGFCLFPNAQYKQLKQQLQAPPSTGTVLIKWLLESNAAKINLYGFDFFSSLSLSGRRTAQQVPHNFKAEKSYIENLLKQHKHLHLHSTIQTQIRLLH